jgi:hypothetical protein
LPKYKFLSALSRFQSFALAFTQTINLNYLKNTSLNSTYNIEILMIEFTSRKSYTIINARYIIHIENSKKLQEYIQSNYIQLIEKVKNDALKSTSFLSSKRFLPIKFVRLYIYSSVVRKRQVAFRPISSGLFSVIEWDTTCVINPIEVFDKSQFEIYDHYILIWDENQLL